MPVFQGTLLGFVKATPMGNPFGTQRLQVEGTHRRLIAVDPLGMFLSSRPRREGAVFTVLENHRELPPGKRSFTRARGHLIYPAKMGQWANAVKKFSLRDG